jgi:prevent-host-death family protein
MRPLQVEQDILPIAQFKAHVSELVQRVKKERRPLVVTVNGSAAAVVIPAADFDEQRYTQYVRERVRAGLADVEAGRVISDKQLERRLKARYGNKKKRL